jgi:hypothetical protein
MKKATLNYWLDVAIGLAFAVSALSGIVFLLPMSSGDQILGLGTRTWSDLHTWSSLLLVGGVLAHLALHWKWIVQVSRKRLGGSPVAAGRRAAIAVAPDLAPVVATEPAPVRCVPGMSRRAFLVRSAALGFGAGIGATVLGLASRWGIAATPFEASSASSSAVSAASASSNAAGAAGAGAPEDLWPTPTPTAVVEADSAAPPSVGLGVACRRGLVHDPYPGRCRRYLDRDGDGLCDYSIPGSGGNVQFGG